MTVADPIAAHPLRAESPTVMVVDDDRLVLLTLAHGLRQAGYRVLEADNGDEAILMARAQRPALALLDIRMQGLSGFDVAQHLKDYAHIPFMFISAYDDEDIRRQARELGALACLSKPVDLTDLLERVRRALRDWAPSSPDRASADRVQAVTTASSTLDLAADAVGMAVGLLMQRYSLDRVAAVRRLNDMAVAQEVGVPAVARQLLDAHESSLPAAPAGRDVAA